MDIDTPIQIRNPQNELVLSIMWENLENFDELSEEDIDKLENKVRRYLDNILAKYSSNGYSVTPDAIDIQFSINYDNLKSLIDLISKIIGYLEEIIYLGMRLKIYSFYLDIVNLEALYPLIMKNN
jgi:hypothetical protein